jgi:hypothetical protein
MQNFDHNIGFWEKRQFFRRKLPKIAENCDHNIDVWLGEFRLGGTLCTSGSSVKTTKVAQIFGLGIFYTEHVMCLIKHGLGYIFGDFLRTQLATLLVPNMPNPAILI